MIKEKEVEIKLSTKMVPRLLKLGYSLPTYINPKKDLEVYAIGALIKVRIEHLAKWCPVRITRICDNCKEEKTVRFNKVKPLCFKCSTWKIGLALKGENNGMYGKKGKLSPRWNPIKTNADRLEGKHRTQAKEHQRWSKAVMELYDFTCQHCDRASNDLESHHIESWNSNKELRFEISNGMCFCRPCHREFHRIYGKGNNTRKQLDEFIGWTIW
jgi:hypothetical protein